VRIEDPEAYSQYRESVEIFQRIESDEIHGHLGQVSSLESLEILSRQAKDKMAISLERIRRITGYENFLKNFGWEEIGNAITDMSPLVYLITTSSGSLALIIAYIGKSSKWQEPSIEAIWLDEFNEAQLLEILTGTCEGKVEDGWLGAYFRWLEFLESEQKELEDNEARWFQTLDSIAGKLWVAFMGSIVRTLQAYCFDSAFLIPFGFLALLPLHAAWWEKDGQRHYALRSCMWMKRQSMYKEKDIGSGPFPHHLSLFS
jgi:hypothetical protein